MINLRNRTEYSFRHAIGRIKDVVARQSTNHSIPAAGIVDRNGTWGHVRWAKECKEKKVKPIFGVELAVVGDMEARDKQETNYMSFLARNAKGLRELYDLVTLATEKFYYVPRLDYSFLNEISDNIVILSGPTMEWRAMPKGRKNIFIELNQLSSPTVIEDSVKTKFKLVATGDNLYPRHNDNRVYQVIMGGAANMRTVPSHILEERELYDVLEQAGFENKHIQDAIETADRIGADCSNVDLPKAKMVHPKVSKTLEQLCLEGARERKCNLKDKVYAERLKKELDLIHAKEFEDYFYVVIDMITFAKSKMFVGPARGSSCGSLVCYLTGITDIDPIPFDLLFERFIDMNREDYPDIDIDFADNRREQVFDYLRNKYGWDNVSRLGTVNVFKAKSAITITAKELSVPVWETEDLKRSIIERSTGDSRAQFCLMDTFDGMETGRAMLRKYPELRIAAELEGHASHTGMHAAGIIITAEPVTHYCSINKQTSTAMLDKKDAESLNLLKIDALGLRTLSVLQDTLDQIGKTRSYLQTYPITDKKAFRILNRGHFAGIFQFEGYALQSLCKQLPVEEFEDIVSLTALARPGPLNSGGATEFLKRRTGKAPVSFFHPLTREITQVTYGVVIYQEQVMQIARTVGTLSWENVSELRKAMSKSMGKEFFDKYWQLFWKGAKEKGIKEELAKTIWDNINTMGSWAFNRSHAVAYGMMSYWCCVLKAHHPLEFAASCLRNAKDDEQSVRILRELTLEGYKYKPFDAKLSEENWTVRKGLLIGGLRGIKGVGPKLAESIIRKRRAKIKLTPRETDLLKNGTTPWDKVFECKELWGHIIKHPSAYGIESPLTQLKDITQDSEGKFVFIAKLTEKDIRDHNELSALQKRGGQKMFGQTLFLNMTVEDDTASILLSINRHHYLRHGLPIVEAGKIGDWYLWKGEMRRGFRKIYISRYKKLTGNPDFTSRKKVEKSC